MNTTIRTVDRDLPSSVDVIVVGGGIAGAAMMQNLGSLTIKGTDFIENEAHEFGGAMNLYNDGSVVISNSNFVDNYAHGGEHFGNGNGGANLGNITKPGNGGGNIGDMARPSDKMAKPDAMAKPATDKMEKPGSMMDKKDAMSSDKMKK